MATVKDTQKLSRERFRQEITLALIRSGCYDPEKMVTYVNKIVNQMGE